MKSKIFCFSQIFQIQDIPDMSGDRLPSLDSTMALIASRRSIMPKDLSGDPLQKTEVKNFNENFDDLST